MAKKQNKPRREMTKRQLSHWQQQRKRQRITLATGITIIVAVLVTVLVGWVTKEYIPVHETVIKVNSTEYDMNYYIKMLKLNGIGQSSDTQGVAIQTRDSIVQSELVRQEAEKLGIIVSDAEVDEEYEQQGLSMDKSTAEGYKDIIRVQLLVERLRAEYFDSQIPASAEQRHIMAMFLESESQANDMIARMESGDNFTTLAGEFSLEGTSRGQEGDLGWHPGDILSELLATSVPGGYAFGAEMGVLSEPLYDEDKAKAVGYWVFKIAEHREDAGESYVQAMLLGSAEEAQQMIDRLNTGESFAALAAQYSQDDLTKEQGGELGWVTRGMLASLPLEDAIFGSGLETGDLSEPVRDESAVTPGGYWLVKVVGIDEDREVVEDDREILLYNVMNDWVYSLPDKPENDVDYSSLTLERMSWAIERAMEG